MRKLTREYLIYKEGDFKNQLDMVTAKLIEIEKTFKIVNFNVDAEEPQIIIRIEGVEK